jgi:hypothetical protein
MENETSPKGPGIKIAPGSSELAPFIYCDGVATYGVNNGVIQLELASNTIMPEGTGTRTDYRSLAVQPGRRRRDPRCDYSRP